MRKKKSDSEVLPDGHRTIAFVRELMEGKSEEEIREAENNYQKYLALVKRIVERLDEEGKLD